MIYKNVASQKIAVYAYDSINDGGKAGDAGNITAEISKDGAASAATDDTNPTELDAADHPGIYIFDMTQAETNADLILTSAVSSTSDIYIEPVIVYTVPGDGTALAADAIEISGDSTAADNLEAMYDGAGYAGGTIKLGVDAIEISGDSTAADNAELFFDGTGYAGTNNVIPTVTTLTGHTAQTGDSYARLGAPAGASVSADIAAIDVGDEMLKYMGPGGYGVYLHSGGSAVGTVFGVDGTFDNPVDNLADAHTLASTISWGASGDKRIYILNTSTEISGASLLGCEIVGLGPPLGSVININGQVSPDVCKNLGLSGEFSGDVLAYGCALTSALAAVEDVEGTFYDCYFYSNFEVDQNGATFVSSRSPAGTSTEVSLEANADAQFFDHTGDLTIKALASTNEVLFNGAGVLTIDAACSGGTVYVYGVCTVTDNSGGSVTIIQTAVVNQTNFMSWLGTGTWQTAQPWNSAWDAEVESEVDDALDAYGVAKYAQLSAATAAGVASTTITDTIQLRPFDTFTVSITGLGSLTGRSELYFAVKENAGDADADSLVLISEGTGAEVINGAPAAAANDATLVVDNVANGDITVSIVDATNGTGALDGAEATNLVCAVKAIYADGTITTLGQGSNFTITQEVIDAVS